MPAGVVETVSGYVRGSKHDGVWAFKGVPYGDDTGGENRFRPASASATMAGSA